MDLQLAERVVAITGGSAGLGLALADRLLGAGARVAICGRDEERLRCAQTRLLSAATRRDQLMTMLVDVTRPGDVEKFAAAVSERWGNIHGLVNNAGRRSGGPFPAITDAEWYADIDLKVMAAVRANRAFLPHLAAAADGSILNVLNHYAKAPAARTAPTSVSRAAGLALTKVVANELGSLGVRVNALLIGVIASGQWESVAAERGIGVDELYESMAHEMAIPLGRVGRADEFADVAAFLLSPRSSYITGAALNLDGGLSSVV